MSRFYAPKENVKGDLIHIDGQEARHILNVMRLKESDSVIVFDGSGREYKGFIKEAGLKSLTVKVISTKEPTGEELAKITLVQAMPKKDKMDYIVEKATELGVSCIIPAVTERTVVRLDEDKANKRVERWARLAKEAAKQCGRTDVPRVENVQKFYNIIDKVNEYDLALMACLSDDTVSIKEAIADFEKGKIIVFIGPEGDFTPDEITMAKDTSCRYVSLGKRILKSDTAGIFLLSVLNHEISQ